MSRVGKVPIAIPQGVTVQIADQQVKVKGPKGELARPLVPNIAVEVGETEVTVTRSSDAPRIRGFHGLARQLINNMVTGVSEGFSRTLLITGVGYRAEVSGANVMLNLGYSNPIEYRLPDGVTAEADGPNKLTLRSIDKETVGRAAAEIRSLRPPEPYKGKGIRYENEYVRRKVGKSGIK